MTRGHPYPRGPETLTPLPFVKSLLGDGTKGLQTFTSDGPAVLETRRDSDVWASPRSTSDQDGFRGSIVGVVSRLPETTRPRLPPSGPCTPVAVRLGEVVGVQVEQPKVPSQTPESGHEDAVGVPPDENADATPVGLVTPLPPVKGPVPGPRETSTYDTRGGTEVVEDPYLGDTGDASRTPRHRVAGDDGRLGSGEGCDGVPARATPQNTEFPTRFLRRLVPVPGVRTPRPSLDESWDTLLFLVGPPARPVVIDTQVSPVGRDPRGPRVSQGGRL